jgi:hypothetical protein
MNLILIGMAISLATTAFFHFVVFLPQVERDKEEAVGAALTKWVQHAYEEGWLTTKAVNLLKHDVNAGDKTWKL